MASSFLNTNIKNLPRGLRNNNPGNLRISAINWQGKIPINKNTDKSFEQFTDLNYGVRAMLTDVANDITIKKLDTLTKLINSYAPPSENDTTNYIKYVSNATGLNPGEKINLTPQILQKIVKAKILIENGASTVAKYLPDLDFIIYNATELLNPATKKRINLVKAATGTGLILLLIGAFFFLNKRP